MEKKEFSTIKQEYSDIWEQKFKNFDDLKNFCEQFDNTITNNLLSLWINAASKIITFNTLKGKRINFNSRYELADWVEIINDWAKSNGIDEEITEAEFVVAAVNNNIRIFFPFANATRYYRKLKYTAEIPGKMLLLKIVNKDLKRKRKEAQKESARLAKEAEKARIKQEKAAAREEAREEARLVKEAQKAAARANKPAAMTAAERMRKMREKKKMEQGN